MIVSFNNNNQSKKKDFCFIESKKGFYFIESKKGFILYDDVRRNAAEKGRNGLKLH